MKISKKLKNNLRWIRNLFLRKYFQFYLILQVQKIIKNNGSKYFCKLNTGNEK